MSRVWALRAECGNATHFLLAWSEEGAFRRYDALTKDLGVTADHFIVDWCQMEVAT